MTALLNWFTKYEALAIWLEGIALVLIFIWDRIDARRDHEETIRQIKLAQDQITAMQNAERAWIMAEVEWPKADNLKVVLGSSSDGGGPRVDHTTVTVMLTCRNEGPSPAFVDKILAYGEIVRGRLRDLPSPVGHEAQEVTAIGALAPGKSATRCVQLTCSGHVEDKELFSIFVSVRYRDIFNCERVTTCGYTVTGWNLYLQDMLPERNRVT